MNAAIPAQTGGSSRFATSLIDLLDRVHYRRVTPDEQFDPVYRLRYEAYRREDFIPINSQGVTRDAFDEAANCYCFGVYIDDALVSSIRIHHVTAAEAVSPSYGIWPDILGNILESGGSYIDPSRFTADHEASLAFPALPYLTLRIAVMASKHFAVRYCISSVRAEHAAFYKRVFGSEQLAGDGNWGELAFPVRLYASYIPIMYPRVITRFPFFNSTEEERALMFGPGNAPIPAIAPSARQAQRLALLDAEN